jgi:uncharacterized linocin/CFP29 family protein
MNNLHRDLAPISEAAWDAIESEATRTIKRHLGGRRIVDVRGPDGVGHSAMGTGHTMAIDPHSEGVHTRIREVLPLVEIRVPFELQRQAIDDVERGAEDSDWQAVKDAARQLAFAEDRAIFEGYAGAHIEGIRQQTNNPSMKLPADARAYPDAVSQAVSQLRLVGVNGPYSLALSADAYTMVTETSDSGYPIIEHLKRVVDEIVWAPAISGAFIVSTRGGDFTLNIGEDVSIGYLSHTEATVRLYLEETMTFLVLTQEASVAFSPA